MGTNSIRTATLTYRIILLHFANTRSILATDMLSLFYQVRRLHHDEGDERMEDIQLSLAQTIIDRTSLNIEPATLIAVLFSFISPASSLQETRPVASLHLEQPDHHEGSH